MNHAYVDGSFDDGAESGEAGRSGFGIVLLLPQLAPQHIYGRIHTSDNNAAELRAVAEALRHAPTGQALTVHTDNLSVLSAIRRGSRNINQHQEALQVHLVAEARQMNLHLVRTERHRRHMQTAHMLANDARLERVPTLKPTAHAEVNLQYAPWRDSAVVTLRRSGERVSAEVPRQVHQVLPQSVQTLLMAVQLAFPNEILVILHASKLAVAFWENPKRALPGNAQDQITFAREYAKLHNIQLFFERGAGEK